MRSYDNDVSLPPLSIILNDSDFAKLKQEESRQNKNGHNDFHKYKRPLNKITIKKGTTRETKVAPLLFTK